jgi:chromosome segregation ATPase
MAKKVVTPVEVQASVKGDESIKSFRTQLREAQQDALRLAEAFGETDVRTRQAAQRVADLKDRMEDVNATIRGLHPDRFERIAAITGTLANGFAAAQGAAALLGGESEDLQRAMVKVQGAMAFAQGVAGLKDMKFMLAGIGQQIMSVVVPAFSSLAGAARAFGAALGIGIIITGLTLVIQNFEKIESWLRRIAGLPDWKAIDRANKARITDMEREIELMEAREATEAQIMMAKANAIVAERKMLREKKSLSEEEKKRHDDLGHELNVLVARAAAMRVKTEKEAQEKQTEDMEGAEKERREKAKQRQEQAAADRKAARDKEISDFKAYEAQRKVELDARWAAEAQAYKARKAEEAAYQAYITKLQSDSDAYRTKLQMERLQRDLDGLKKLEEMKADAVIAGIDLINAVTTNANAQSEEERRREFKRRQAFDLANTALSTYFAAQKAYESQFLPVADASSPIRATIAAAMAIASGLGRVAAISKQRYQPGGGISAPQGAGGGGFQRPTLPASSTLGGGSQMAGQWNNRVYVTEGDITGTQRRVNMLRGASVI